jgi:hypothetical protein
MARLILDSEAAVLARVGRIDRSIREADSRLDEILTACHHRLADGYGSKLLRCRRTEARKY